VHNLHEIDIQLSGQHGRKPFTGFLLTLDPGQTTGVAFFHGTELKEVLQQKTPNIPSAVELFTELLDRLPVDTIVIEDYHVYAWRAKQHAWSDLYTPRMIGAVEAICAQRSLPLVKQSAQIAKGFVTDTKLKAWELYRKGMPHARDAVRHGCYYILFGRYKVR